MKTSELLKLLAEENQNKSSEQRAKQSWTAKKAFLYWLAGSVVIFGFSLWLLPVREDLADRLRQVDFFFLSLVWGAMAFSATKLSILSTFPEERVFRKKEFYFLFSLFGAIAAWVLFRLPTTDVGFEWYRESNPINGGCGMVIFLSGTLHAALSLTFFRKGASTNPKSTGSLLALSTGAFSTLLIQFACANEHPLHVFLWHIFPLMILSYLFSLISVRVLRWV
jgi:hypothetical protein